MIVFGGNPSVGNCNIDVNDTWVMTHANGLGGTPAWIQLAPTGAPPSARANHMAAYNPASNRMIVFGGNNECQPRKNDVWILTNANGLGGTPAWSELSIGGTLPDPRADAASGYDPTSNRLVVYGGIGSAGVTDDIWVLANADGTGGAPSWSQSSPTGTAPDGRFLHPSAFDPAGDTLFFHGGLVAGPSEDAWRLNAATATGDPPVWEEIVPAGAGPPARDSHSLVHRASSGRLIVFGGRRCEPSCVVTGDTWVLSLGSTDAQSYEDWQMRAFPPGIPADDMLPNADPDFDQLVNFLERFVGSDPLVANGAPFEVERAAGQPAFRFVRSKSAAVAEGHVEWSTDLVNFTRSGVTSQVVADLGSTELIEARIAIGAFGGRVFVRLIVETTSNG